MLQDILVTGLVNGGVYALLAIGFSLIFGVARIVNIAHTAFYMLAAYCFYALMVKVGLGFVVSALVAVGAVTALSVICYRLVIEPVREHEAAVLIATIALALIFQELMLFSFGGHYLGIPSTLEGAVRVLGVSIPLQRLLILVVAAAMLAVVWFVLYRTRLGLAIRATANDLEVANLMGMNVNRVAMVTVAISVALAAIAGVVVALRALPAVYGDPYVMRILTMSCLFAIFAASWDLLAGYTGQVNFGHALLFGAGAYTSALVSLKLGVTPWASVFAGAAMATLFGFLAGYLCLRLRGSYLSLATLAFPLIALGLLFAFPDFSGGELGISGLRRLTPSATGNYYVAAVSMLLVVFGLWTLADSKFGLVLHAIRDDEVAARASGINTPRYRLIAFAVSAAAAGFAGALFAHYLRVAGPYTLEVALSFQVVIWGIFGGVATIYGPVAAVFILYPLTEWLGSFRAFGELRLLIFAVIVLLVLLFMPRGLAPWMRDKIETQCPRCKQRNTFYRKICRLCGAALQAQVPGAQGLVGHQ